MSKYAHVVKLAGQLIGDGYLEKIVKNQRHNYGVGIVQDDKILLVHQSVQPDIDSLKAIQEKFKESVALFAFGDVGNILDEDRQPLSIIKDADGNDVCIVALDGDFDRHRKSNDAHTGEYQVTKSYIEKTIRKLAQTMGPEDIIKELNDDITKQNFCNLWGSRGCITFLFSTGQVCTIRNQEDDKGKYSWGFASDPYGYMENVGSKEEVKDDKPAGAMDMLKSLMGGGNKKPKEAVPQNGATVSSAVVAEPAATSTTESYPPGTTLVKPDFSHPSLDTRKKQKSFYEDRLGYEPQHYRNATPLLRIPQNDGSIKWQMADTKSMGIFAHTQEWYPAKDAASKVKGSQPAQTSQPQSQSQSAPASAPADNTPLWLKSKSPKEVGGSQSKTSSVALPAGGNDQAKASVPASVRTDKVPVLPPDQKQKVQEILKRNEFVGLFGENMKKIIDPKDLRKQIETEVPDYAKSFGLGADMSVFDGWSYEQFFQWATALLSVGKPDVIAKFMFDQQNYAIRLKVDNLTNPNIRGTQRAAM